LRAYLGFIAIWLAYQTTFYLMTELIEEMKSLKNQTKIDEVSCYGMPDETIGALAFKDTYLFNQLSHQVESRLVSEPNSNKAKISSQKSTFLNEKYLP
jgi:hypothetical protein